MTVALLIKVNDGLVLAADSASTLTVGLPDGQQSVVNTYNNANKIFNLHKSLPIGAMTWGLGNIGPSSIATLAKDARRRFQGGSSATEGWQLDPDAYRIESVAESMRDYLHGEKYQPLVEADGVNPGELGFLVAGYSAEADEPTAYVMNVSVDGQPALTEVLTAGTTGAQWWGQPDAIARILNGTSIAFPQALLNTGAVANIDDAIQLGAAVQPELNAQLIAAPMPIQDAIDLAEFLVYSTIQFVRFTPGPPTVGGPIEIATITKHEGFRWVRRKHYFDTKLNPVLGGSGHAELA
ncbi:MULTISPECIES: hypothetical protein [unclassified Plantibacter]|uniref:hypothetical protein n=1 Tax=unclassified Plantibacter TaxID=2624265 RepID=UPI0017857967|nr:hypothetical protein [Plantibacter sp. CFBP 8804]MBD8518775.1 hypothetical protein [Plantibacter sp. CFBP 8804]